MMNIHKLFKSNYLKAADLEEDLTTMVIDRVGVVEFDAGDKAVLFFRDEERGLVLNKTTPAPSAPLTATRPMPGPGSA